MHEHAEATLHSLKVEELCQSEEGARTFQRNNIHDYLARSQIEVAEHHMRAMDGDLHLAVSYLEKAQSGKADEVIKTQVEGMLKVVRNRIRLGV